LIPVWVVAVERRKSPSGCLEDRRNQASRGAAVMLHLLSCYVSKAAIFNGLGAARAGRKSKSRFNSKGLDRWAPYLATVLPLRV